MLCLIQESDCDLLWCYSSCFHHEELARYVNVVFDSESDCDLLWC